MPSKKRKRKQLSTTNSTKRSKSSVKIEKLPGFADNTDLIINCKDVSFHVHRIVLMVKSDFFKPALKERSKEESNGIIDLRDEHTGSVRILLQFCYDRLSHLFWKHAKGCSALAKLAYLYALADRLRIREFQERLQKIFAQQAKNGIGSRHLSIVIDEVYTSTPASNRGLRDVLVNHVKTKMAGFVVNKGLRRAVTRNGQFGYDLLMAIAPTGDQLPWYTCPSCEKHFTAWMRFDMVLKHACPHCGLQDLVKEWIVKWVKEEEDDESSEDDLSNEDLPGDASSSNPSSD